VVQRCGATVVHRGATVVQRKGIFERCTTRFFQYQSTFFGKWCSGAPLFVFQNFSEGVICMSVCAQWSEENMFFLFIIITLCIVFLSVLSKHWCNPVDSLYRRLTYTWLGANENSGIVRNLSTAHNDKLCGMGSVCLRIVRGFQESGHVNSAVRFSIGVRRSSPLAGSRTTPPQKKPFVPSPTPPGSVYSLSGFFNSSSTCFGLPAQGAAGGRR
jgi:hypothetical protein